LKGAIALLVVVLALKAGGASASTSVSTFTDREASAVLVSNNRGLHTSVDIVVSETERTSTAGVERTLNASIEIFQTNPRRPNAPQIDVAGGVDAELGALQMNGDLTEASAQLTIPVCGAQVLPSGRLKPRPFTECFDAKVDLRWTGAGELVVEGGPSDMPLDGCTVHVESRLSRRPASAGGSVLAGGVNLTPNASSYAAMSVFSETSTVTCPD
jgi:hypothetical protein